MDDRLSLDPAVNFAAKSQLTESDVRLCRLRQLNVAKIGPNTFFALAVVRGTEPISRD